MIPSQLYPQPALLLRLQLATQLSQQHAKASQQHALLQLKHNLYFFIYVAILGVAQKQSAQDF
jgi:hypothetical protein